MSLVKDNNAYIFGGRNGNKDISHLIKFNIETESFTLMKSKGQKPKGRRKPAICLNNNNLFCFSGFDGAYIS